MQILDPYNKELEYDFCPEQFHFIFKDTTYSQYDQHSMLSLCALFAYNYKDIVPVIRIYKTNVIKTKTLYVFSCTSLNFRTFVYL